LYVHLSTAIWEQQLVAAKIEPSDENTSIQEGEITEVTQIDETKQERRKKKKAELQAQREALRKQQWKFKRKTTKEKRKERGIHKPRRGGVHGPIDETGHREKRTKKDEPQAKLCIDLGYDAVMTEKEVKSLRNQLGYSYGHNRKGSKSFEMIWSSFGGRVVEFLAADEGYINWTVRKEEKSYLELFPKEEIVYLSSESPNVLEKIESNKVYVIGGLVDHNRLKGITFKTAIENGVQTARLPIAENVRLTASKVLTVNQVVEILVKYLEFEDWKQALRKVIPERKVDKS